MRYEPCHAGTIVHFVDTYRFLNRCIRPFENHRHKFVTLHQFYHHLYLITHGWPLQWNRPPLPTFNFALSDYGYQCNICSHGLAKKEFSETIHTLAGKWSTNFNWRVFVYVSIQSIDSLLKSTTNQLIKYNVQPGAVRQSMAKQDKVKRSF